jgi:hypothetical protein
VVDALEERLPPPSSAPCRAWRRALLRVPCAPRRAAIRPGARARHGDLNARLAAEHHADREAYYPCEGGLRRGAGAGCAAGMMPFGPAAKAGGAALRGGLASPAPRAQGYRQ